MGTQTYASDNFVSSNLTTISGIEPAGEPGLLHRSNNPCPPLTLREQQPKMEFLRKLALDVLSIPIFENCFATTVIPIVGLHSCRPG
jgi:hypothetical protein